MSAALDELSAPLDGGEVGRGVTCGAGIGAPMLVMVERGDDSFITENVDRVEDALRAAGKPHKVVRYDSGEGHALFASVRDYWPDLIEFLRDPLQDLDAS